MSKSIWLKWLLLTLGSSLVLGFGACLGTTLERLLVATAT